MSSIRYRMVCFLLASLFFINLISGSYIYQHTQEEIEELFNAEQAQLARTIDELINQNTFSYKKTITFNTTTQANTALGHHYEKKIAHQVWDDTGNLVLKSQNAPDYPLSGKTIGFSRTKYKDETWHIFSMYSSSSQKWIFTAQKNEVREELIGLITRNQLFTMMIVSIMITLVVAGGVTYGIRPIKKLSHVIAHKSGDDLSQITMPISQELLPIKNGVNRLLERIDETLTKEKSFSADLSHELKTPLSAIKIHAQNIELTQALDEQSQISINKMLSAIENMSATIEQLLMLNRIESTSFNIDWKNININNIAKEVITTLPPQIHTKNNISLSSGKAEISASPSLISILVRNLIENASKYSHQDSNIYVQTYQDDHFVTLEVKDNGPGMTDEQKENAVKRYYRVSDSFMYGSGLGLSIVKKIVDLHKGNIAFLDQENDQGLIVKITFNKH